MRLTELVYRVLKFRVSKKKFAIYSFFISLFFATLPPGLAVRLTLDPFTPVSPAKGFSNE